MGDLSAHFSAHEFACKCKARNLPVSDGYCGGKAWVDPDLVAKLEKLRSIVGAPITITSGCRCEKYNRYVGGAPASQHVKGTAADVQVRGKTPEEIAAAAEEVGFGGIGLYNTFTHVDVRKGKARWDERR